MSIEPEPERREDTEEMERSPYSATLAQLGKKMRVYGNTNLVLMIVTFLTSIFLFEIVRDPIISALVIIFIIKAVEWGFFIDFLTSLKKSDSTYGGHFLYKAFLAFFGMVIINLVFIIIGVSNVSANKILLESIYSGSISGETVFYFYTMMSAQAPWLRLIEILILIAYIIGSLFLHKWGQVFIGERLEDEVEAPFPKEMRLMIYGAIIVIISVALNITLSFITIPNIHSIIVFCINLTQILGSIVMTVGTSRAGYYLELYTTQDKKKFFSSKLSDDGD